ncbi:MAG: hypothetical protein MJ252_26280, partial [archaeon]|nr:hypothetical protein [archaeon]
SLNSLLILMFFLILFPLCLNRSSHKSMSRFERKVRDCGNTPKCSHRVHDEDCIYTCVHEKCYKDLIANRNTFIEFGEINNDFKKEMEKCYNGDESIMDEPIRKSRRGKKKRKR